MLGLPILYFVFCRLGGLYLVNKVVLMMPSQSCRVELMFELEMSKVDLDG